MNDPKQTKSTDEALRALGVDPKRAHAGVSRGAWTVLALIDTGMGLGDVSSSADQVEQGGPNV